MTTGNPFRRIIGCSLFLALLFSAGFRLHAQAPPAASYLVEWKTRDAWQRPEEVMDVLRIGKGSKVADLGCGSGYFTSWLADRVGPEGRVFAVDMNEEEIANVRERVVSRGRTQVVVVLGAAEEVVLPSAILDAVLMVDTYHEISEYDLLLARVHYWLKPGGLLGIIDAEDEPGQPRQTYSKQHTMPESVVREDAARHGFRLVGKKPGFMVPPPLREKKLYFLLFEKAVE